MLLIKRAIPIISSLIFIALIEYIKPGAFSIYLSLTIIVLAVLGSIFLLAEKKLKNEAWALLISPLLFVVNAFLFFLFLEKGIIFHILTVMSGIFLFIFLENVFIYLYQPEKYQPYTLENISNYINLVTIFLASSNAISLITFLSMRFWLLGIPFFIIVFLLIFELLWASKITWESSKIYIIIISLILLQVFWAIKSLPTSFYVGGLIIASSYYILSGLTRYYLLNDLDKKVIIRHLIVGFGAIIISLGFAQWL